MTNKRIFICSMLLGVFAVMASASYTRWTELRELNAVNLTPDIAVSEQLKLNAVHLLRAKGYATIIDLRPDGEAQDQPLAAVVARAAESNRMHFAYVPVPHGEIPESAVAGLEKALAENPKPILLYCRSGRRAARTWSLVEASRPGGLDAAAILSAVKNTGQTADDLSGAIAQRIAQRNQKKEAGA